MGIIIYVCDKGGDLASVSGFFRLDFQTVLTVVISFWLWLFDETFKFEKINALNRYIHNDTHELNQGFLIVKLRTLLGILYGRRHG